MQLIRLPALALCFLLLGGCDESGPDAIGKLSVDAAVCVVAEDTNSCQTQLAWSSENARQLSIIGLSSGPAGVLAAGVQTVSVPAAGISVSLVDEGRELASLKINPTCAVGNDVKPDGYCRLTVLHYKEKVYAVFPEGSFIEDVSPGIGIVSIERPYPDYLFGCRLKKLPEANGRIKISCTIDGISRIFFYINPVTNKVTQAPNEPFSDGEYNSLESAPAEVIVPSGKYIYYGDGALVYQPAGTDQRVVLRGPSGQCNRGFCSYNQVNQLVAYSN